MPAAYTTAAKGGGTKKVKPTGKAAVPVVTFIMKVAVKAAASKLNIAGSALPNCCAAAALSGSQPWVSGSV